ncbi:hypothetical protein [Luteolibacter soli]|uniref:hypothetical protein n=1 Tax=Luteolibacter soli TaxID=3135280 RepID=UPI003119A844
MARIAGWESDPARRLSYFSQAPDDLAFCYSAPAVAVWGSAPGLWGYRHRIVAVLHSLHGGDADAVLRRREDLRQLVAASSKTTPGNDWKTGFLIHAMGDSYAHVKPGPDGREVAYGQLVGHGFDNSVKPDHISAHFDTYRKYVTNLHAALAIHGGNAKELNRFLDAGGKAANIPDQSGREESVKETIQAFHPFDEVPFTELTAKDFDSWKHEIKDVDSFLRDLEKKLR